MVCFFKDAISDLIADFRSNYLSAACAQKYSQAPPLNSSGLADEICRRDSSLLALILLVGTLWLALSILHFRQGAYITRVFREILSEYALPIGVIVFR